MIKLVMVLGILLMILLIVDVMLDLLEKFVSVEEEETGTEQSKQDKTL